MDMVLGYGAWLWCLDMVFGYGVSGIYSRNPLNSILNSLGNKFPKHRQILFHLIKSHKPGTLA